MSFLSKIFGDPNEKYLRKLQPTIDKINMLESKFEHFSNTELREKTKEFKKRLEKGETLDDILPEAFALVREAAKRTLHQRHFDVQLIGGIVLHQGKIAEMKTGEGKTLAATLPLYLNALEGKGCHLVTVNDYLARRDTVWMGQIYHLLGLKVGCLNHDQAFLYDPDYKKPPQEKERIRDELGGFYVVEDFLRPCSRKEAYLADITYGTNNEFGFDYLRDNMAYDISQQVQRGFHYAIVDEVDSILIDEARTPLIISQPDFEAPKMYKEFARIIPQLKENIDYNIDEKMKVATLTEEGIEKIEKILGVGNIYTDKGIKYLHHLEQALKAQIFFQKDRDYIVKDGKVIIVDEFTGRLMPGRRWSGGLHQAIEAKEGVEIQPESKTLAAITFQNFFRMYKKLAGMTGTALTSAEEFDKVYGLTVVPVPTNKPMIRKDLPDRVYKTQRGKYKAIVEEIKKRHQKGQPILVGTTSIEKNEYLSKLLEREGIPHEILNAKNHQREGQIIAQAGKLGQVTVATNMAGRGVDIVLGGNPPDPEEAKKVKELGGLHVIGTERHEARRIDNQLRGRAGRQGDPGSSQFFISLEDDLLRVFGGERIKALMEMLHIPEDQPIEAKILSNAIEKAQARVEGMNFDLRKHVLEYDDVIAKHRNKIYSQRQQILEKSYEELKKFVLEKITQEIENIVEAWEKEGFCDYEKIIEEIKTIFPVPNEVRFNRKEIKEKEKIVEYLKELAKNFFKEKEEKEGKENMEKILRFVCLRTIDMLWSEHLDEMEYLKDSVRLRAYGGRDPLVEYKTEGHRLFQELEKIIDSQIAKTCFKLTIKRKNL
ncbi:MAG: preprotein translocase subunit SecA [Candidatus Nealsonbacteria bacterium]|nr:MAG: preprotein translocase subunit SecA [Candidatus Nealsonbacteria bacterium]